MTLGSSGSSSSNRSLYVDDAGTVRDGHIEHLFKDLYDGQRLDDVALHNLRSLAASIFADAPPVPADAFENVAAACEWVASFGTLHLSVLRPLSPDLATRPAHHTHTARFTYGATATTVTARGIGLTALLAVVQYIREHAERHNNQVTPH